MVSLPGSRGARLGVLLLLVTLLGSVPAVASAQSGPVRDSGRIDLGPGWRYETLRGSSSFGGAGRFSWHIDARWFLGIELGAWAGRIPAARLGVEGAGDMDVFVGDLRVALGGHITRVGPVFLYGVGGGGYHLVGVTEGERYREGATQGLFLGAGAFWPLTDRVGLFIEDRWTFLSRIQADVAGETPMLDIGGNLLWVGLVLVFEPERRPAGPLR
jgi:hypothetical protein